MQHALITPQSESEQLATLAAGAMDAASRQQTRTAGSATYHNPDGTKTMMGADAAGQGIAQWVGDTTPPGTPTGVTAQSGNGLVLAAWDGSLDGGVPADFDHVQILVDGTDAGRLTAKGTLACGPYEPGTGHTVTAVAWDDAHAQDGSPAPNASPACAPIRVTVTGADIDPDRLGITVTKSDKDPQGRGEHTGDLWLKYPVALSTNAVTDPGMESTDAWTWTGLGLGRVTDPSGTYFRMRPGTGWSRLDNTGTVRLAPGDEVRVSVTRQCENPQDGIAMYLGVKDGKGTDRQKRLPPVGYGKWVTDTVRIAIPANAKTDDYALDFSVNNTSGNTNTVVLCKGISVSRVMPSALEAEWWWDGSKWMPIPVAIYLDQLAARDVQVDEAVVGMLAAGIIRSGTFVTDDGLVGFDASGFWAKDATGDKVFTAGKDGVHAVGGFATATSGNRIIMSQTLVQGTRIGGIQGQDSDDTNSPNWFIWGYGSRTAKDGYPSLQMGVSPQMPEVQATRGPNGSVASLTANYSTVHGTKETSVTSMSSVTVRSPKVQVQGIPADFADYDPAAWLGWSDSYQDYNHATRLYKRAGVYFLELNIQIKKGVIPSMQTIPVVRLASSIMPDHRLDVLAYGSNYSVGRFHVFGLGESQPQGTISIGTRDTSADFFSGQMFWSDPRKA